jgi:hypothetical protein
MMAAMGVTDGLAVMGDAMEEEVTVAAVVTRTD